MNNNSKIAALCPIHRNEDLIIEQLKNYDKFSGGELHHILHPSIESKSILSTDFLAKLEREHPVSYARNQAKTRWNCVLFAYLQCTRSLDFQSTKYVYIHTDGDLIVKGDLYNYINRNEVGYSCFPLKASSKWRYYEKMLADPNFSKLRNYMNLSENDIYFGRQEGSFFPVELWSQISEITLKFFTDDFVEDKKKIWPIEEVIIPTLAMSLTKRPPNVSNVVSTKKRSANITAGNPRDNPDNWITIEDVKKAIQDKTSDCIGLKWFSQNMEDDARIFLKSSPGQ